MPHPNGSPVEGIRWQPNPGDRDPLWVPILAPKPGSPVSVWVVSQEIVGVVTHWLDRRTRPCTGPRDECEGCLRKAAFRWKGYLGVWCAGPGRYALAELTKHAVATCPALRKKEPQLRGKRLILRRAGGANNAAVSAEVTEAPFGPGLPPDFNIRRALCITWYGDDGTAYEGGPQQ